ncbi:MAG: DUF1800 family protein [Polyangiaceae bacterium]|jgi:uncharacterized protein (DUF1800 family)
MIDAPSAGAAPADAPLAGLGPLRWPGLPTGPIGTVGAARLMAQGTFGATLDGIQEAATETYAEWFAAEIAARPTLQVPLLPAANSDPYVPWWTTAVKAQDQLRQRVSFALSEILVVSDQTASLVGKTRAAARYEDLLTEGAFGNFRDLLDRISRSIEMGLYLSYFKNTDDPAAGVHADENYAREIMQLFTVGLWMLNADGSQMRDAIGHPIPTYALSDVEGLARVFTGWGSNPVPPMDRAAAWLYSVDEMNPMVCYLDHHDLRAKTIIGGVVIPAGGTCESDLKIALDTLFAHPNVGPFIGKQLIERLVTSNPSPAYVRRVSAAFANDGHGVRGNLLAVVEAVLTDPEAVVAGSAAKLREPILAFTNLYRAFSASNMGDGSIGEGAVVETGYLKFDEQPMYSPSVFNFFRPDYELPGTSPPLVGPEFQITNESTVTRTLSQIVASSYQFLDSANQRHSGWQNYPTPLEPKESVLLHTSAWEPFASAPATLVDKLDLVFMAGEMSNAMKGTIVSYVAPISTIPQNPHAGATAVAAQRVIEATVLVVTSPQFAVQR